MNIKFLVMDVDGTLTDGKIYMGDIGEVFKAFSVKDGYAIGKLLPLNGIIPIIITSRQSRITENRCRELGIKEIYQNVENKFECMFKAISDCKDMNLKKNEMLKYVAYIGDDISDLDCMKRVTGGGGVAGCPSDAAEEVRAICSFVSRNKGGEGAVREFIEYITGDKG